MPTTNYNLDINLNITLRGRGLEQLNAQTERGATKASFLGNAFSRIVVGGLNKAADAAIDFANDSNRAFSEFDAGSRQIFSLVPELSEKMKDEIADDAIDLGKELGRLPNEVLPSLYQALSLGIPQDNIFEDVTVASEAARAGNADLEKTLVTGQSIINAYGEGVYELDDVYDILFTTVKNGAVTFDEINQGMSAITSVAGEAHVPLEDIGAAIVTMTKQGDSFSEVSELMSNVLSQLAIEGSTAGAAFKDLAGISFVEFMDQGNSFADALTIMDEAAKASGQSLLNIVGGSSPFFRDVQAARGLVELTGRHLEEFKDISLETADAGGAMAEAYGEVAGSMEILNQQTEASTEALKVQLGEALEPTRRKWLEMKIAIAELAGGILTGNQAVEEARKQFQELEVRGFQLGFAMDAVVDGNLSAQNSWADTETITERTRIAIELLENGYEGNTQQLGRLIDMQIEADQKAQVFTEHNQQLAAAQAAIAASLSETRTQAYAFNDAMDTAAEGVSKYTWETLNVTKVLDGDTLKFETVEGEIKTLRFANINTAEIDHSDYEGGGKAMPWADEAMEFTQNYIDNNPLEVSFDLGKETYGRMIGDVKELEEQLIQEGLAIPVPEFLSEDPESVARLTEMMQEAAAAGRGMFEDQELAARALSGELVDLGEYYAEIATNEAQLKAAYEASKGPVEDLLEAQQALAEAQGAGSEEAAERVTAAQAEIQESYQNTALAAMEAALAGQAGGFEQFLALQVEIGNITQETADARLEMANMTIAAEELGSSADFLKLTTEQQATALGLLTEGYVTSAEEAILLADQYASHLNPEMVIANEETEALALQTNFLMTEAANAGMAMELTGENINRARSYAEDAKGPVTNLGTSLSTAGSNAETAAGQIGGIKEAVDSIPSSKTITINVVRQGFGGITAAGGVGVDETVGGGGRAAGGPVFPNTIYPVGEGNAPEILATDTGLYMIPGDRGEVFSNQDSNRLLSGDSFVINIDARGATDPQAVEDAGYRAATRAIEEASNRGGYLHKVR